MVITLEQELGVIEPQERGRSNSKHGEGENKRQM
jgi:hypothetical protein